MISRVDRRSYAFLEAYYFFEGKGMWPNAGGWQDQPGILLQAFQVIERERRKIAQDEDKHE